MTVRASDQRPSQLPPCVASPAHPAARSPIHQTIPDSPLILRPPPAAAHATIALPAHVTLVAACDFAAHHALRPAVSGCGRAQWINNRAMANRLRELDRFLSILLDDVAGMLTGVPAAPRQDAVRRARADGSAGKLRRIEGMTGTRSDDHARLRAIGRIAARLRHDDRPIHASSLSGDLRLAVGQSASAACFQAGNRFSLSAEAMGSISLFYRDLGDRLVKQIRSSR